MKGLKKITGAVRGVGQGVGEIYNEGKQAYDTMKGGDLQGGVQKIGDMAGGAIEQLVAPDQQEDAMKLKNATINFVSNQLPSTEQSTPAAVIPTTEQQGFSKPIPVLKKSGWTKTKEWIGDKWNSGGRELVGAIPKFGTTVAKVAEGAGKFFGKIVGRKQKRYNKEYQKEMDVWNAEKEAYEKAQRANSGQ